MPFFQSNRIYFLSTLIKTNAQLCLVHFAHRITKRALRNRAPRDLPLRSRRPLPREPPPPPSALAAAILVVLVVPRAAETAREPDVDTVQHRGAQHAAGGQPDGDEEDEPRQHGVSAQRVGHAALLAAHVAWWHDT